MILSHRGHLVQPVRLSVYSGLSLEVNAAAVYV